MATFVPTPPSPKVERPLHIQNKFKFYDISWKIEHFFLQTCEENWEICTPELDGPKGARLKLILKSSRNEDITDFTFSFTGRRTESDSGPEALWVNYRASVSQPKSAKQCVTNKLCSLNKGSESEIDILSLYDLFDETKNVRKQIDSLRIDCKVLLYFEGEDLGLECSDAGLMSLSEDMRALFESSLDFDTELKLENSLLQLHKSILCSRSKWFNAVIKDEVKEGDSETLTIDISKSAPQTHYEGLRKIVTFLYTGNLKYVLEKPSLEVYDLACRFNIQEVKSCYMPETLSIVSAVDAQTFDFNFRIANVNSTWENQVVLMWSASAAVRPGRTWLFHFCPRKDEDTEYASFYVETNEEIKSMNICFEVTAVNKEGWNLSTTKMLRRHVNGSTMFGLDEFEYKKWMTYYAIEDALTLDVIIKMSTGKQSSYIRKHLIPTLNVAAGLTAFRTLSLDMKAMLYEGDFYDVDLLTPDSLVMAHRCVLAARCKALYDMITNSDGDMVLLQSMTRTSLLVVLSFVYCGCIYEMEDYDVVNVLAAAKNLNLPLLAKSCLKFTASNFPEKCMDNS